MALIIPDAEGIYAEAEPPMCYDPAMEAYKDTEGHMYNHAMEAWKKVWPTRPKALYLYNQGDECTDITGGWVTTYENSPQYGTWTGGNSAISKEPASMVLTVSASSNYSSGSIVTANPIDLTNYNTMYTDVGALLYAGSPNMYAGNCNAHMGVGISGVRDEYVYGDYVKRAGEASWIRTADSYGYENFQNSVIKMDISGLTGSYYVFGIMAHSVGDYGDQKEMRAVVNAVWLE